MRYLPLYQFVFKLRNHSTMNRLLPLVLLLVIIGTNFTKAQHNCSVSREAGALIKQRLMDNRQQFTKAQVKQLMNNRSITYIPVSIHSVANSSGEGAATEKEIFAFLCGLNKLYLQQDVQFFIYNQINFVTSNNLDNDASSNASRQDMNSFQVNGTVNITIARSQNNPSSSWYNPGADNIFLLKQMMSAEAKTEAHEIGHFFTLPHTFYGWEGQDAEADYAGQNVPSTIGSGWGSFSPEAVARTGSQANCQNTADGFCDTEADYYSSRTNCPYVVSVKDPYGNNLDPDESNIMSYALDACVTTFSNDQQAAVAMDIANRTWVTNTPGGTVDLSTLPPVIPVTPANNATLGSISNSTVRLDWTGMNGATWYYIEVYGTILPGIWAVNVNDVVYRGFIYSGNDYFDLSTTGLQAGKRYAWRITPYSNYSTCALPSPYYRFEATTSITTSIKDLPIEKQMSLEIQGNPVTIGVAPLKVYSAENVVGNVSVYSLEGKAIWTMEKTMFYQGESLIQLPVTDLANGVYMIVVTTDRGVLQKKMLIQR